MRKHENYEEKGNLLQVKYILPIAVLLLGFLAFNFITKDRGVEAPDEPAGPLVITETIDNVPRAGPMSEDRDGTLIPNPDAWDTQPDEIPIAVTVPRDSFDNWSERVKQFGFPTGASSALRRSVEKYGALRANQCSGNIIVRTSETSLNIRSGPAVSNSVIAKANKGAAYDVLMWANDEASSGNRWFLLVDDRRKVVRGWVSGEFCDTSGVTFAN